MGIFHLMGRGPFCMCMMTSFSADMHSSCISTGKKCVSIHPIVQE